MEVSTCCGAIPLGETYANMGMCSSCLENTDFYDNEEEEESPLATGFKHKDLKKEREKDEDNR